MITMVTRLELLLVTIVHCALSSQSAESYNESSAVYKFTTEIPEIRKSFGLPKRAAHLYAQKDEAVWTTVKLPTYPLQRTGQRLKDGSTKHNRLLKIPVDQIKETQATAGNYVPVATQATTSVTTATEGIFNFIPVATQATTSVTTATEGIFNFIPAATQATTVTDNYYSSSSSVEGPDNTSLITLTTVNIMLSICCIVLSIIIAYFRFVKSRSKLGLIQALYLQNGLADFFVGLGVFLQSPLLYLLISKGDEISDMVVPVFISYSLTAIAVKMSVFMNCILGIVRCINIAQPFYKIKRKALTACTIMYMFIWMLILGIDLWQFAEKRGTKNQVLMVKTMIMKGQPGFGLVLLTMEKEDNGPSYLAYQLGNLVQFIVPTALPILLCFVLMIVQLCSLHKTRAHRALRHLNATKQSKEVVDTVSKASLTIFLLTSIYVSTSAVSLITWLIADGQKGYLSSQSNYEALLENKRTAISLSDLTAIYFSLSTCALICSTLTPLTLLLRGTGETFGAARQFLTGISSTSLNSMSGTIRSAGRLINRRRDVFTDL